MTQPPIDPDDEPLGGSLAPVPEEAPEPPEPPAKAAPPPAAPQPPPAAPAPGPYPPPPSGAYPPPAPAGSYPPPPPPGSYPPPPPGSYPPPPGYPAGGAPYAPAYPGGDPFAASGMAAHRGNLVLGLAIAGILCCGPLSIVAYIFGRQDIAAMDAGRMDPTGRSTTNVGRVLGLIGIILLGVQLVFLLISLASGGLST